MAHAGHEAPIRKHAPIAAGRTAPALHAAHVAAANPATLFVRDPFVVADVHGVPAALGVGDYVPQPPVSGALHDASRGPVWLPWRNSNVARCRSLATRILNAVNPIE